MYRIVHNEQTDAFRVEKRGLLGWAFVSDPRTGDYLQFRDADAARSWIRTRTPKNDVERRWKVVSDCDA